VKEGGEACIVTFSWGQKEKNRKENGYDVIVLPAFDVVHSFPFPMFWMPSFWTGLYRAKSWRTDIVHTHTRFFLSSFLWGIFAKYIKKPWIHIEHGSGFVVSWRAFIERASRLYDHTLGKWTLTHADEVVAVSEACEHFVRDTFGVKDIRTIYRGINPTPAKVLPSEDEIHIGYIGRLVDLKGVDVLIESFAGAYSRYNGKKPLKLRIVWDGPERKKLEKLTEKLTLSTSVEFLGQRPIDEVRSEFLPSLHIFVNPSFQEWLPTTVIEALIAGCRVIATDVWGTREILRHAPFTLVAPRSVRAISEALSEMIHSQNSSSSRISPSLFLWEQTFREFREIYNQFVWKKH
jgi:glycosyltransferase involved in cell wall biosynthesis